MVTFINMVITRVKNVSPDMILTAFDGKLDEHKMRYLPGSIENDLILSTFNLEILKS